MTIVGYGIALIVLYFWIKCNWFVPLVMLVVSTICFCESPKFTWFSFFVLAGICYAPILARFFIRGLIEHVREEMAGRTFKRYVIDSFVSLGDPPAKQPTARRPSPPLPATGPVIEHLARD